MANLYSQYEFESLQFCFEPTIGTQNAGAIMFCYNYDAGDVAPATEIAFMDYADRIQGVVWDEMKLAASPSAMREGPTRLRKYTRLTPIPSGVSPQIYDVGNFYLATNNMLADGTPIGKLTVKYSVLLYKPQLEPSTYPFQSGASTTWETGQAVASGNGSTLFKALGTLPPSSDALGAGAMVDGKITIPVAGLYAFNGDIPMGDDGKFAGGSGAYMQSYVKEANTEKRIGYSRDDNSSTSLTTVNHNFQFYAKKGVQIFSQLTGSGTVPVGWLGAATVGIRLISLLAGLPAPLLAALDADPAGVIRWDGSASYEPPDV